MNLAEKSEKEVAGSENRASTSGAVGQHTFVVENLERRIRDSAKLANTPSIESHESARSMSSLVPDPYVLASLEDHAKAISANIDVLLRDLRGSLHGKLSYSAPRSASLFSYIALQILQNCVMDRFCPAFAWHI